MSTITLRSVSVGQPAVLGERRGVQVSSGIRKIRVETPAVTVSPTNIEGDGQADLRAHGGPDKAIYCYPSEHLPFWNAALGDFIGDQYAPLGENLSLRGIDEETACIGDIWQWGNVTVQISQPRWPCYKLQMHTGAGDMINRFVKSGRSGWYLRVLNPGTASTSGTIEITYRDPEGITVGQAFDAARNPDIDSDLLRRINEHPALAGQWRR